MTGTAVALAARSSRLPYDRAVRIKKAGGPATRRLSDLQVRLLRP
jgi:hypothetical protein